MSNDLSGESEHFGEEHLVRELLFRVNKRRYEFKLILAPYWTAEIYGFGKEIARYGYYPYFLPLCVETDHGPGYYDEIPRHEVESDAPAKLYHSKLSVELWGGARGIYCLFSPFIFYRRRKGIEPHKERCGTIAFPAHTTPDINDEKGYGEYIKALNQLTDLHYPIHICLHMHDIRKGLHREFIEKGYHVVTAGNTSDQGFISRFYELIRGYKYATSNIPGSYAYYCVEMGIPFFIHGPKPNWVNKADKNLAVGEYDPFEYGYGKVAYEIFSIRNENFRGVQISAEQEKFVKHHLGVCNGVTRKKMAKILYLSLIRWLFRLGSIRYIAINNIIVVLIKRLIKIDQKN